MRFEVRSPGGTLYGTVDANPRDVQLGTVRFAMARRPQFYGPGYLSLEEHLTDRSFRTMDMRRSTWVEPPQFGTHGTYRPGRCEFVLIWDGPREALLQLRTFECAR